MPEQPKIDKETQEKIQALQIYEQNFQSLLMQKQAFQVELHETEKALEEIKDSKEDVFKVIGQIIIKTTKEKLEEELTKELEKLRQELMEKFK